LFGEGARHGWARCGPASLPTPSPPTSPCPTHEDHGSHQADCRLGGVGRVAVAVTPDSTWYYARVRCVAWLGGWAWLRFARPRRQACLPAGEVVRLLLGQLAPSSLHPRVCVCVCACARVCVLAGVAGVLLAGGAHGLERPWAARLPQTVAWPVCATDCNSYTCALHGSVVCKPMLSAAERGCDCESGAGGERGGGQLTLAPDARSTGLDCKLLAHLPSAVFRGLHSGLPAISERTDLVSKPPPQTPGGCAMQDALRQRSQRCNALSLACARSASRRSRLARLRVRADADVSPLTTIHYAWCQRGWQPRPCL
jgi:hypothetical protein